MNANNMQGRGSPSPRGKRGAAASGDHDQDSIGLGELLGILWRRKWLIAAFVVLGTTVATLAGTQVQKRYTATAALMLEPSNEQVVNLQQVVAGLTGEQPVLATQIRLMTARDQIARVMDDMQLFQDPEFNPALDPENKPSNLDYAVGGPLEMVLEMLPENLVIATGLAKEKLPVLETEAPMLNRQAALDRFARNFEVRLDDPSYVMLVSFTSRDPQKAADVANRVTQIYVEDQINSKSAATTKANLDAATAAWMNERLESVPLAPSLDPASPGPPLAPITYAFCTDTPPAYPCGTTRRRLDERGTTYAWVEAGHDAPLTRPHAVAELLLAAARHQSTGE